MTLPGRLSQTYSSCHALLVRAQRRGWRFEFEGVEHPYFTHSYNETWRNERAVEIPVVTRALRGNVLEVGNVLAHYGVAGHTVVDKYEQAANVLNVDALDFETTERFDSIVSISTVEHMGFDEDQRDDGKPRRGVERLARLLAPGGELLVTIPFGYNPAALGMCAPDGGVFSKVAYLKRVSEQGRWQQVGWDVARACEYGAPYEAANAVAFGFVYA